MCSIGTIIVICSKGIIFHMINHQTYLIHNLFYNSSILTYSFYELELLFHWNNSSMLFQRNYVPHN